MPSTNIPLQSALTAAQCEGLSDLDLLRAIQSGEIKTSCGMFVKANIWITDAADELESTINRLRVTTKEKISALEVLKRRSESIKHYRFGDDYYTFVASEGIINVYSYGDFRTKYKGEELNSNCLRYAWIDTKHSIILCDDIREESRREYMDVEINRLDLDRWLGRIKEVPQRRGPKTKMYVPEVEKKAILIIQQNPTISKAEFTQRVFKLLKFEMGATQFAKYYGKHWTENNRRRRALGI